MFGFCTLALGKFVMCVASDSSVGSLLMTTFDAGALRPAGYEACSTV